MFIVAAIGVACNVLMMLILGHHHHGHACSGHSHGPAHSHAHHGSCGSGGSSAACELAGSCGGGAAVQLHAHAPGCCGGQLHSRHRYAAAPAADVEAGEQLPLSSHGRLHDAEEEADGDYVLSAFVPILGAAGAPRSDAGDPDQHAKQAQQRQQARQQRQAKQQQQQQQLLDREGDAALAAPKGGSSCGHGHANMNMRGEALGSHAGLLSSSCLEAAAGATYIPAARTPALVKSHRLEQLSTHPSAQAPSSTSSATLCSPSAWRWPARSSGGTRWGRGRDWDVRVGPHSVLLAECGQPPCSRPQQFAWWQ